MSLLCCAGGFVGDGIAGKAIALPTGNNWTPKVILLKNEQDDVGNPGCPVLRFASHTGSNSHHATTDAGDNPGIITTGITAIGAGGFTVGDYTHVNAASVRSHYIAFGGDGVECGSYVGDGLSSQAIAAPGIAPGHQVQILRQNGEWYGCQAGSSITHRIYAGTSTNDFVIGTDEFIVDTDLNVSGQAYRYAWFKEGLTRQPFTRDAPTVNLGYRPDVVFFAQRQTGTPSNRTSGMRTPETEATIPAPDNQCTLIRGAELHDPAGGEGLSFSATGYQLEFSDAFPRSYYGYTAQLLTEAGGSALILPNF